MPRGRTHGIQASPFLPALPAIALGNLGRVINPGTVNTRGLITTAERLDHRDAQQLHGPSSYTRQPVPNREGGIFPATVVSGAGQPTAGRPTAAFHRKLTR